MRHGLLAPGRPLVFYVFFATACARRSDSTWRVENKDVELDVKVNVTLSDTTMNSPLLHNFFTSVWRHAAIQPQKAFFSTTWLLQFFYEAFQYGIVVTGVIDAFCLRNLHLRNADNPRNLGDGTERRIRFMTAITPTYARAYQSICLARRPMAILHQKFRLHSAKARYPHLPKSRTTPFTPIRASLLVTTLVSPGKVKRCVEQRAYLPSNARSEVSVLQQAAPLRDPPRFHLWFLDLSLFCCLAHFCFGKQCCTMEATDFSSTSTRPSLLPQT